VKIQVKPLVALLLSMSGLLSASILAATDETKTDAATSLQVAQLQQETMALQHELSFVQNQLTSIQGLKTNPSAVSSAQDTSSTPVPKKKNTPTKSSTTQQSSASKKTKRTTPQGHRPDSTRHVHNGLVTAYDQDVLQRADGAGDGVPYGEYSLMHLGGFAVITSPYLHPNVAYDGGDLIANFSSINRDADMLQQRAVFEKGLHSLGFVYPSSGTLLELSGEVQGQIYSQHGYGSQSSSDIDLSDAELDMQAIINRWVTAYANFVYDDSPTAGGNRTFNSNVYVDNAFLTLGNLNASPWRATIGQLYIPFGLYNSFLVSNPVNKTIFRTEARPLLIGYGIPGALGFAGSIYTFTGDTRTGPILLNTEGEGVQPDRSPNDQINRYGIDLNYGFHIAQAQATVGASYINNVADSQGMQATGYADNFEGFNQNSGSQVLAHTVPGMDFRGKLSFSQLTLLGEYTTATQDFNVANLSFNGRGAQPSDYHLEGVYAFNIFDNKPATFALGYDHSYQALALNVPEQQIAAALNISFIRNTLVSLEYRHQINYSSGDTATGSLGPIITPDGSNSNAVTAQFSVYF
jgi:hypothetical protein